MSALEDFPLETPQGLQMFQVGGWNFCFFIVFPFRCVWYASISLFSMIVFCIICKDKVCYSQRLLPIVPTYNLLSVAFMLLLKNCTRSSILNLPSSLFSVLLLKMSSFSWLLSILPLKPDSTFTASGKPSRLYYSHPKSPRKLYHISCVNYHLSSYKFDHIILMYVCVCSDSPTKL